MCVTMTARLGLTPVHRIPKGNEIVRYPSECDARIYIYIYCGIIPGRDKFVFFLTVKEVFVMA